MSNRKRQNIINFRVDDKEKHAIENRIKSSGLSKERFFREIALKGSITVYNQDLKLDDLIREISRIGNNINQIARNSNAVGGITKKDLMDLKKRVEEVWQLAKSGQYGLG